MDVLIIGGGFAGLAAAVDLAAAGCRPLVLERRSFLGGRAYSFTDKTTGDVIDNGQHLMMGCYHSTLEFLEKIGSIEKLKFQPDPQVDFIFETGGEIRRTSFKCPPLPPPLHLVGGLARLGTIGWSDRAGALRVGLALRRLNGDRDRLASVTVRQWLNSMGQSERIQSRFWDIMALATLNESAELASADMFARVLDQAFLHTKRDSAMVISKVGLSDLYTNDARSFIESAGGEVRLNADVAGLIFENDRALGVRMRSGEIINAGAVISAVPYFALNRMIDPQDAANPAFRSLDQFKSAPIISINLWYEDRIVEGEFVGLLDSPVEWVFNKNAIGGDHKRRSQHLALVISGAHEAAKRTKEELIELAVSVMKRFFPGVHRSRLLHAFVVREHDATMSHTVGMTTLRPSQKTTYKNFFLAGDWTATGLPATIESAVWSGQECGRMALQNASG